MTTVNFYSKEQTDAKLEHVATKITDKDEYYEINSTSAITAGADVPVPTIQDAGKFLKVGDNADLIYGEGGGSGDKTNVKSRIFTDVTSLHNFLVDVYDDEPKYILSLIKFVTAGGGVNFAKHSGKEFNSNNFRISLNPDISMSSYDTECSIEMVQMELRVLANDIEITTMQTNIAIENTSSTKDIHHGYYESASSLIIGNDYHIEILYTES